MEQKHRNLLTCNRVYLVQNLELLQLLDYMIETQLLNDDDRESLQRDTKKGMAREFLSILPRRGPQAFEQFIEALMRSEQQKFIAYKLDPALAAKYETAAAAEAADGGNRDTADAPITAITVSSRTSESDADIIKKLKETKSAFQDVKSTTSDFVQQCGTQDLCYRMSSRERGHAVIINNEYFVESARRVGCQHDIAQLQKLFRALHFHVILHENKSAQEIKDIIRVESGVNHTDADGFILYVMSHGENGYIAGMDEKKVSIVDDIVGVLGGCSSLRKKPKMLFFQACRVVNPSQPTAAATSPDSELESIRSSYGTSPDRYRDFFIAYATIPGFAAWRDPNCGSWFVQFFVYVCSSQAHYNDLGSMMTKVNSLLDNDQLNLQQVSQSEATLNRLVYFFPGYFQD